MDDSLVTRDVNIGSATTIGLPPVNFKAMHEIILPYRLNRGVSDKIAWDVSRAAPIAFQTPDGHSYSYVWHAGAVRIVAGVHDEAELVIELSADAWQNYYYDLRTRYGLLYEEAVRFIRGRFRQWDAWEPALRCLYSGTPIYDPKTLSLQDRDGASLDIRKSFGIEDDPEAMSHFLRTTGYVHVRGVFSQDEIARLSDETDRLRDSAIEGDVFSRWAASSAGEKKVWDLHYMAVQSDLMRGLDTHPQILFLNGLAKQTLIPSHDRDNGTHAILREFTGSEASGSNYSLGWHQDCGLGGCPITCPRIQVGIQLDAATPESSQLFFLAGSAGRTSHDQFSESDLHQKFVVTFETEPGDVTVHLGCGLHAAPQSNGRLRRRTIYTRHQNPAAHAFLGRFQTFDQVIPNVHQMPTVDEMAKRVESRM